MDPSELQKEIAELQTEIVERYGIRGRTLRDQVRKLGRLLPRYERGQARVLVEAETALGHPKMAMRVQVKPFQHAKTALMMHLETVNASDRRKGALISTLTVVLVNVALALIAILAFVAWRGLF